MFALTKAQENLANGISEEEIQRYNILRSLMVGHPFGIVSDSNQMVKPEVSDDTVQDPWINGIFRSAINEKNNGEIIF